MCIVWGQGWGMNQPTQWRIAMLNAQRLGIHGGAVAAIFYEMLPGTVITVPNKPWQGRIMGCSAWDKLVHVGWVFNSPPFLFNFLHHIPTLTQRHKPPNSVCICSVILKVVCMYPKELTLFILFFFFPVPKDVQGTLQKQPDTVLYVERSFQTLPSTITVHIQVSCRTDQGKKS